MKGGCLEERNAALRTRMAELWPLAGEAFVRVHHAGNFSTDHDLIR